MDDPALALFDCPRHHSLRLTPGACAGMWRKAKALPSNSLLSVAKCKGCHIGAGHAGEMVEESRDSDPIDRLCARCGRGAKKFVRKSICVSCANRQYEFIKGANARGNKPVGIPSLQRYFARILGREVRQLEIPLAANGGEAWLSMMRDAEGDAYMAFDGMAMRGFAI